MLKYVVEEVGRVKAMYEDRLARMTAEQEAAREAAQSTEKRLAERLSAAELRTEKAGADAQVAADALAQLQKRLGALPQQLEVPSCQQALACHCCARRISLEDLLSSGRNIHSRYLKRHP